MNGPVIVTGAAGFIGSHVVEALLARGDRVVGVDNFDPFYDVALKRANLASIRAGSGQFEFVEADITDAGAMRDLFKRAAPETVIHLAAKAGVRPSLEDPAGYAHANVTGTAVLLAAGTDVQRFIVASSSSVYGNNEKIPFAEDDRVDRPISPYAATKLATEAVCHAHHAATKVPIACLRFFTVYGPRQRPDLAIRKFMRLISQGEPIPFFGDGSASRDFTYIDDIVGGVLAAADRIDRFGFRIWNLGSDAPVKLRELVQAIERTVGRKAVLDPRPAQTGDVERTWADLSRARAELEYAATMPLAEGLARQWAWMQDQRQA